MIIGITGTIGAGKGAVVAHLVRHHGFVHVSARSVWTRELQARNMPVNRDTMTALANQLRAEHGADYFVRRALTGVDKRQDVVIESIRTVGEALLLKQHHAVLLAVDADVQVRYTRIHGRKSALDQVSYREFVSQEAREMHNDDPHKQNLAQVMSMADYTIVNNGTLSELHAAIEEVLRKIHDKCAHSATL